jgi:hypothetical protein
MAERGNGNGARLYTLRRWHGRIGAVAALFVLLLSVTGLALNHAETLDLYRKQVRAGWIMDWSGSRGVEGPVSAAEARGLWVALADGHVFAAGRRIGDADGTAFAGAAAAGDVVVAGGGDRLFVLTPAGELVETLGETVLPGTVARIGVAGQRAVIETVSGRTFAADEAVTSWREAGGPVVWSEPAELPAEERKALDDALRGEGLPLYRIVLDIHAGRFFTRAGPFAMDLAALALIALSASGLWTWLRQKRFRR